MVEVAGVEPFQIRKTSPKLIDGLRSLRFGNDGNAGPASKLFFTAGPDHETNGLFGTLTPVAAEALADTQQ